MAELGKQFAHLTVAYGLLPGQFDNSPNLRELVKVFVGEDHAVQELESVLFDCYSKRWLWIATGAQLEGIGDLLEEPRETDDDDEYRQQLYLKILVNVSQGEPERLIEAVERATLPTEVHLIEKPQATVLLYAHVLTTIKWIDRVSLVASGGVMTVVTGSVSSNPFVFGVDRDASGTAAGAELAYGTGWGESGAGNEGEGGLFAELYLQD